MARRNQLVTDKVTPNPMTVFSREYSYIGQKEHLNILYIFTVFIGRTILLLFLK